MFVSIHPMISTTVALCRSFISLRGNGPSIATLVVGCHRTEHPWGSGCRGITSGQDVKAATSKQPTAHHTEDAAAATTSHHVHLALAITTPNTRCRPRKPTQEVAAPVYCTWKNIITHTPEWSHIHTKISQPPRAIPAISMTSTATASRPHILF